MFDNVFLQIGAILGLAAVGGALAQVLRQPLIVAFIAVGILRALVVDVRTQGGAPRAGQPDRKGREH